MKSIVHDLSADYKQLELYILSDVHIGDKHHDTKQLKKFMDEVQAADNRYLILNGDIVNMATKNAVSDIYGETMNPNETINYVADLLEPVKHKILAITEGNHEARAYKESGIAVFDRISRELGIPHVYAPDAALLFISFGSRYKSPRKMIYSLYVKHGSGGGGKTGGKINKAVSMSETIAADCFIMSHVHQPIATRKVFYKVDFHNHKATPIEQLFVTTNSFLTFGGYGESFGFTPSSNIYPKIILDGQRRYAQAIL